MMNELRKGEPLTSLEVVAISSCDGCGACCTYVGVPPGYGKFYFSGAPALNDADWESIDGMRWRAMPDGPRAELIVYNAAVDAGTAADRTDAVTPCLWYDPSSGRCRHYEWRPQVCRDFARGSANCLSARQCENIA
jgi:uncharacterized protein